MGKIKRVARDEDEQVVTMELVVRVTIVAVEPSVIVIVFHVEHVEIAVRIEMCKTPSLPLSFEYS